MKTNQIRINILIGGPAGTGPNILTEILGKALVKQGYFVFYSRDYQSLIRGGHNFNTLTLSNQPIYSNDFQIDVLVCLDEKTEKIHKEELKKEGIILKGEKNNIYYAGRLFKLLGLDFKLLEQELRKLKKRFEENINEARRGYSDEKRKACEANFKETGAFFMNGNKGIAEGAIKSGLGVYYAYPMTPATSVLAELAGKQVENNFFVITLENEIACVNAAIGSAITGAKSMVGTSGGGFDLMTEGLSLTGIAEVPLVMYLAQRPGPATGVPTYTGQGDLNMARHSGHGEFQRVVVVPGDPKEAQELTSQAFYFSQKYKIPAIILGDKHLAESWYTLVGEPIITKSEKLTKLMRYNSYEKDENGSTTENPGIIKKNIERRRKKVLEIEKDSENFENYKIYGEKSSKNILASYGSPKGAILDAIKGLDVKFIQILYIEPFPKKIKEELKGKNLLLVENNSTGMLADVMAEKLFLKIDEENKILRYDARPFLADELREEIKRRLK